MEERTRVNIWTSGNAFNYGGSGVRVRLHGENTTSGLPTCRCVKFSRFRRCDYTTSASVSLGDHILFDGRLELLTFIPYSVVGVLLFSGKNGLRIFHPKQVRDLLRLANGVPKDGFGGRVLGAVLPPQFRVCLKNCMLSIAKFQKKNCFHQRLLWLAGTNTPSTDNFFRF